MLWYLLGCVPHAPTAVETMVATAPVPAPAPVAETPPSSASVSATEPVLAELATDTRSASQRLVGEEELAQILQNAGNRPLVLNFWATWCAPCVQELPYLDRVSEQYPAANWMLVNVDGVGLAGVEKWLVEHPVGLPLLLLNSGDPAGVLARRVPEWQDAIPLTLVLHPGGGIHAAHQGALQPGQLESSLLSLGNPRICAQHGG